MTLPRKFDGFPPSKSLSHLFENHEPHPRRRLCPYHPPRFPHAINADVLFVKSSPPPKRFPTRKTKAREA